MSVNESARAAGIDLAHVVSDIVVDEVRVELQRQIGGLSDRERRILDMWPRFEDGEPVMIGDGVDGLGGEIIDVYITENAAVIWDNSANHMNLRPSERVKRPAPKVLDADGVEIEFGDTVWHHSGFAHGVVTSIDAGSLMGIVRYVNGGVEFRDAAKDLTHTRPDSWEQLEEDIAKHPCLYAEEVKGSKFDSCSECPWHSEVMARDIVRRAKALAGVEVAG